MLVAQRDHRPATAAARSRAAPQPAANVPVTAPPSPQHHADQPLSRTLAHAVQQRARDVHDESCCDACSTGGSASPCEPGRLAHPANGVPIATLQRAKDEGFFDSIWDKAADYLEAIKSTGAKIGTALDLSKYPSCEDSLTTLPVKPDVSGPWLDDKGLESLRHREGELLSKSKKPKGATAGTLKLVKQALHAWGCERLGRDLLPKAGTTGPFGPETAAAVKQLQLFSGLSIDGVVGRETLAALDTYVGVHIPGDAASDVGGSDVQGKSSFQTRKNPVGRIYFPTNGYIMDAVEDEGVLRAIADAATEAEVIDFEIVGYADKRDNAAQNKDLAYNRAFQVSHAFHELLDERGVKALVVWGGVGEIERGQPEETDAGLKGYRRVDIRVTRVVHPPGPQYCTDLLCIEVKPEEKKKSCLAYPATEWQAALENPQVEGKGVVWTTAQVIIRMKHPNPDGIRWEYTYLYEGFGFGGDLEIGGKAGKAAGDVTDWVPIESPIPIEVGSLGKKWFNFKTSKPVKITDFKGPARHYGASAAAGPSAGSDNIRVFGLASAGADEVELSWLPTGIGVGIKASWDFDGELRDFRGGCRRV